MNYYAYTLTTNKGFITMMNLLYCSELLVTNGYLVEYDCKRLELVAKEKNACTQIKVIYCAMNAEYIYILSTDVSSDFTKMGSMQVVTYEDLEHKIDRVLGAYTSAINEYKEKLDSALDQVKREIAYI